MRRPALRMARVILIAMMGVGLAGRETAGSMFGGSSSAPLPRRRLLRRANLRRSRRSPESTVAPIIGAPDAIAKQIQQEFTERGREAAHIRDFGEGTSGPGTTRCAGYIVAAKYNGHQQFPDVTHPTASGWTDHRRGGRVGRRRQRPWATLTPQVAQSIASKAASSFVAWSEPGAIGFQRGSAAHERQRASSRRAQRRPPPSSPWLRTGATTSIARDGPVQAVSRPAMAARRSRPPFSASWWARACRSRQADECASGRRHAHGRQGEDGAADQYRDGSSGTRRARSSQRVSQKNEIPEGSLDGPWEKTAEQVRALQHKVSSSCCRRRRPLIRA